jgi:hypothetical protein
VALGLLALTVAGVEPAAGAPADGATAGIATTAAAGAAPAQPAPGYANPLGGGLTVNPSVLKAPDGTYHAYTSGFDFGFPFHVFALQSTDLASWSQVGNVLPGGAPWADNASGLHFTSPAVLRIPSNPVPSRYVMYFGAKKAGSADTCIGVANAAAPAGPFTATATPLVCPTGGAQDPSVVPLPDGVGIQEIVYKKNGANPGIYVQVLTADGQALGAGHSPNLVYAAQPTWWHGGVVERPAVVSAGGVTYLLFAGGTANTRGRAIGWSPCAVALGVLQTCANQTHLGTFVAGTSQVDSPSGPQVFSDGTHSWLAYDAVPGGSCPASGPCGGTRELRLDKICFAHGQPRTNAPSSGTQTLARSPACSSDVPGAALATSYGDTGTLLDAPGRDGGSSAAASGRSLWFFGDTADGCGFPTNTGAVGVPVTGAPNLIHEPGCPQQLVPFNAAEVAFNAAHACAPGCTSWSRVILWPGNPIGLPDGDALVFFSKGINTCNWVPDPDGPGPLEAHWNCWDVVDEGTGAARVPAASLAAGAPVASRNPAVSPSACNPTCLFPKTGPSPVNTFRVPMVDGDQLYMYSASPPWQVARAPLASAEDPGAWQYWTGPDPDDWSGTYGSGDGALPGFTGGIVSYNPYLDRYVSVTSAGQELRILTATAPTGPWSAHTVGTMSTCPAAWPPYSLYSHAELAMDGGRSLDVTYLRPGNGTGCAGQFRWATIRFL